MMTESTISFREIVCLIHPDKNPGITDVGGKMRDAKLFRNDEKALYRLGVSWGVIKPNKTFTQDTTTPSPSASDAAKMKYREQKIRRYKEYVAKYQREQQASNRDDYFNFRVRNRIFQPGDIVYVRTKRANVRITKVTRARVYFQWNGRESYAAKKNVMFVRRR